MTKRQPKPKAELTDHQRLFAEHYAACLNATEAARLAGYSGNDRTLAQVGSENLRKPHIRAYINELLGQSVMESKEVLARLSSQARASVEDFLDPKTLTLDLKRAKANGQLHLIKELKQTTTVTRSGTAKTVIEVKLHDSQAAQVHIGRAYALFTDNVNNKTWEDRAIEGIKSGAYDYAALLKAFQDAELVRNLFVKAGVEPIVID